MIFLWPYDSHGFNVQYMCHKSTCVVYVGKLRYSGVLGQLMGVVHNRTALKASSSIEESCMLVACIEIGTIIAVLSETKVLQDPLKRIKTK